MALNLLVISDDSTLREAVGVVPGDVSVTTAPARGGWEPGEYDLALIGPDVLYPVHCCQLLSRISHPLIIIVSSPEGYPTVLSDLRLAPQLDVRTRVLTTDQLSTLPLELSLAAVNARSRPTRKRTLPSPTAEEDENLHAYHELYEQHYDDFQRHVREAAAEIPEMKALLEVLPADRNAERQAYTRTLQREAIQDGRWEPYCDDLRAQGALYARLGLPLRAWFELVGGVRSRFLKTIAAHATDAARAFQSVLGFEHLLDVAMRVIVDAYVETREDTASSQHTRARFLSALSESAVDAILACTLPSGRIVYANPAAERLYGYAEGTLIGRALKDLGSEEEVRRYERLSATGEVLRWDAVRRTAQGEKVEVSVTASRILDHEGRELGVLDIARDISERLKTERELIRRQRALERSNAVLEQFAYVSSHDLKEPLRMVAAYGQLLQRTQAARLDERGQSYLEQVLEGAGRMRRLLEDLLEYSRIGRDGPRQERVALGDVVAEALADLKLMVDETAATVEVDPLPEVRGDPTLLRQVFQNLISNAIKFRHVAAPRVRVWAEPHDERTWCIGVDDNGIGIDEEHRERVFVIFQRLHERGRYDGSGLGLAIAKKIVDAHGGRIWVDSAPEGGSSFRLALPGAS